MKITKADIGRKVKLRNGKPYYIENFIATAEYPVISKTGQSWRTNGRWNGIDIDDPLDIIAFVEPKGKKAAVKLKSKAKEPMDKLKAIASKQERERQNANDQARLNSQHFQSQTKAEWLSERAREHGEASRRAAQPVTRAEVEEMIAKAQFEATNKHIWEWHTQPAKEAREKASYQATYKTAEQFMAQPPQRQEVWFNVLKRVDGNLCLSEDKPTRLKADQDAAGYRIADRVGRMKITLEEGRFDD